MQSPSDIEKGFARALLDPDSAVPEDLAGYSTSLPRDRFNIYRNNVHVSLIEAIAAKYPVVLKLVGDVFFRGMARTYIRMSPPVSPVIIHYGGGFVDFLESFEHVADLPYLGDVARLEWSRLEALHAADASPLGTGELAQIDPQRLAEMKFQLHPSLRLVKSDYPVVSIWEANIEDLDLGGIDLAGGGEEALIIRTRLDVEIVKLPQGASCFIEALLSGISLGEANNRAVEGDGVFDLQLTISGLIQCGAFIGFDDV